MNYDYRDVYSHFNCQRSYVSAQPYGEGHINETYLLKTTVRWYILQKVNTNIFKQPHKLMENIVAVTRYLNECIIKESGDPLRETLTLITTKDGKYFYETEEGNIFRMYIFIDDAKSYQMIEEPEMFYEVAKAFGRFQNLLRDFPAEKLYETISNFHNTADRYRQFKEAVKSDPVSRKENAKEEIKFILDRENDARIVLDAIEKGEIPLRVTHNDTKLNNVLIDNVTGEGVCVIDLDTVMPGSMLYDFGDSIRFGASTAAEDETDLSKVEMSLELFEQYTKGYIEELKNSFTKKEIELLAFSAKLMTLECGMRFLTDYLNGDVYFRIHRENHNLDRARTQIKLVADMEEKMDKMNDIVMRYYNS